MSLSSQKARLASLTKEISIQWDQTKDHWKDAKAADFEHKYMQELIVSADAAMEVIDQLEKLINKIKTDCE